MPINEDDLATLLSGMTKALETSARAVFSNMGRGLPMRAQPVSVVQSTTFPPDLLISDLIREYERINASAFARKSAAQVHKWRTARRTSIDSFVKTIGGDIRVAAIARQHVQKLYDHWQQRVLDGEIKTNSANRLMRNLTGLYSAAHAYYRLETRNPFSNLYIRGGREGKRLAYTAEFLQQHILAEGVM